MTILDAGLPATGAVDNRSHIIRGEIKLSDAYQKWKVARQPILIVDLGLQRQKQQLVSKQEVNHQKIALTQPIKSTPIEVITEKPADVLDKQFKLNVSQISQQITNNLLQLVDNSKQQIASFANKILALLAQPKINATLSNTLIGASVALLLLFFAPILILESRPIISQAWEQLKPSLQAKPSTKNQMLEIIGKIESTPEPKIMSEEDVFSINIPDLDINSLVVPNVDAGSEKDYTQALKKGIAHAKGSGLPDQLAENKTIYLFAHSTDSPWNILRYNAQFYALKDIKPGQEINLTFWGESYTYYVKETMVVAADDTRIIQPQTEKEMLILQTCWPPGTTSKRLLVVATPERIVIDESAN